MGKTNRDFSTFDKVVLARATKDWLNYHINTNKEYVISESSLKLPISDYLAQFPGDVQMEKDIEAFVNKKFDVYAGFDSTEIFIELKYVQANYTRKTKEKQRIYNDLLRLSSVAKRKNAECYALICGPKSLFISEFQNLGEKIQSFNPQTTKIKGTKKKSFYKNFFEFDNGTPKVIDCSVFTKMYQKFKKEYELSKLQKQKSHNGVKKNYEAFYKGISKIKVTKIALLSEDADIAALGLWKVERA